MEKKIEDYLHLYLGCEVEIIKVDNSLSNYMDSRWFGIKQGDRIQIDPVVYSCVLDKIVEIKSILRPLSDMTEKEKFDCGFSIVSRPEYYINEECFSCEQVRYMLKNNLDLFGLIESGLAIAATQPKTVKP